MVEPIMPLLQVKMNEEAFTVAQRAENASNLTDDTASIEGMDAWIDLGQVLTDEWEIGGLAMTTDAIPVLVAGG
jgi:phenylpyruvate tautomerase PptA (4-oxalocrotonate tautomerase family)